MQLNPKEVIKRGIIINVRNENTQVQQVGIDLTTVEEVVIPPRSFVNIAVFERFNMQDTFGLINIRSSLSRQGMFCTSGVYDPGFHGHGGVSIYNMSNVQQTLSAGMRIAQMIVFEANAASTYHGVYNQKLDINSQYDECDAVGEDKNPAL